MPRSEVRKIRISKKLTHKAVANASGIKRQYYGMIESGASNPSVDVAKKIAAFLGIEWTIFFEDESNEMLHITFTS